MTSVGPTNGNGHHRDWDQQPGQIWASQDCDASVLIKRTMVKWLHGVTQIPVEYPLKWPHFKGGGGDEINYSYRGPEENI